MGSNSHAAIPALASPEDFVQYEYDYVICGGGTAGLVIAARLTEDPNITVGVIEAGKNGLDEFAINTPGMCLSLVSSEWDWFYKTVPQKHHHGNVHHVPRGKALGGSSAINYMVYVRGQNSEYDDWAEIVGDDGWSAAGLKPYFNKHQTLEPLDEAVKDKTAFPFVASNHGTSGPIRTSFTPLISPLDDAALAAGEEVLGVKKKPTDPWGGNHLGFYHGQATIGRTGPGKGQRSYAARDYFLPASARPNLSVVVEATVSRVVLEDKVATGVEFFSAGNAHHVSVRREVIVCGGVIASPQILELSGVGNPKILTKAGIECLVDLPSVGEDIQDHLMTFATTQLAPGLSSGDALRHPEVMAAVQKQYMEDQSGPLTSAATTCGYLPAAAMLDDDEMKEAVEALLRGPHQSEFQKRQMELTAKQIQSSDSANLYFSYIPMTLNYDCLDDQSRSLKKLGPDDRDAVTWSCSLQFCGSRGSIHVSSADPFKHPDIDPSYSSNMADTIIRGAGLRFLDKMFHTNAIKEMLGKRSFPDNTYDLGTREGRRRAAKDIIFGQYHLCGGCAMGHTVDSKLKVKGVKNLRVADASVFPGHVSGNIQGTVYAVAEKAADLIKEDW
jgi:choline dehydrogenase-like flavoprotein